MAGTAACSSSRSSSTYAGAIVLVALFYVYYTDDAGTHLPGFDATALAASNATVNASVVPKFFVSFNLILCVFNLILCVVISVLSILPRILEANGKSGLRHHALRHSTFVFRQTYGKRLINFRIKVLNPY